MHACAFVCVCVCVICSAKTIAGRTQLAVGFRIGADSAQEVCLMQRIMTHGNAPYVDKGQVKPGPDKRHPTTIGKTARIDLDVTMFDVIVADTVVCDEVGLLPVLVAATPRLKQSQDARLYTLTYAWGFITQDIKTYLDIR